MSTRTHVQQLESDVADAMARLHAVGTGLARLRTELDRQAAATTTPDAVRPAPAATTHLPAPAPGPRLVPPDTRLVTPGTMPAPRTPTLAQPPSAWPPPQPAPPPWYRREGAVTRVLAVTGAVITMAGVAMFLVLAAQRGWFGPQARVAAGTVLAAALVGLGARRGTADQRTGRAVGSAPVALVATGVTTAYLVVVAVTTGYGWVPAGAGLALAAAVALGGLQLARTWASELLAVLVVLGAALLAPAVAQGGGWVVPAYLAILCVVGWWAGGTRTSPLLTLARVVPVTLALLAGSAGGTVTLTGDTGHLVVAALVLAATLVTSAVSVRRDTRDATSSAAVALLAVALLASALVLAEPARTLTLATASAVLLLAATTYGRGPVGPLAQHLVVTTGAGGTVFALLAVVAGAPTRFVTTGLLLLALAGLTLAGATRSRTGLALAAGVAAVAVVGWIQHPVAVAVAATTTGGGGGDPTVALVDSILMFGVIGVGMWAVAHQRGLGRELRTGVRVGAWVLGLGASATALAAAGTLIGGRLGEPALGSTVGQAAATVTWMLAAAWLLLRGLERSADTDLTLRTGLLLAGVSVAKLFLYDLASLSGLVRSVAFIAVGLLLLAMGSRYARAYEQSRLSA